MREMTPQVAVLLASYNGIRWIAEQISSIFSQQDVNVELIVSDDMSTDGTWEWLQNAAQTNSQIVLLPRIGKLGSAGKNFYRLLLAIDLTDAEFIALSDQDDIWHPSKLIHQIECLKQGGFSAVSSNVEAFWPDGKTKTIIKSQPQRQFDFAFESAGPGSTFLMSRPLVEKVRALLAAPSSRAQEVVLHDWLIYAVCRSSGGSWHIDKKTSLSYRQHAHNELGANSGIRTGLKRLDKIFSGWYRNEILKILSVCMQVSTLRELEILNGLILNSHRLSLRCRLLGFIPLTRRKFADRAVLATAICLGLF